MTDRLTVMLDVHSCAERGLNAIATLDEASHLEETIRELLMHLKACSAAEIQASFDPGESN